MRRPFRVTLRCSQRDRSGDAETVVAMDVLRPRLDDDGATSLGVEIGQHEAIHSAIRHAGFQVRCHRADGVLRFVRAVCCRQHLRVGDPVAACCSGNAPRLSLRARPRRGSACRASGSVCMTQYHMMSYANATIGRVIAEVVSCSLASLARGCAGGRRRGPPAIPTGKLPCRLLGDRLCEGERTFVQASNRSS